MFKSEIDYLSGEVVDINIIDINIKTIEKIDSETYNVYFNLKANFYQDGVWELVCLENIYSVKKVDNDYLIHEIIKANEVSLDEFSN